MLCERCFEIITLREVSICIYIYDYRQFILRYYAGRFIGHGVPEDELEMILNIHFDYE